MKEDIKFIYFFNLLQILYAYSIFKIDLLFDIELIKMGILKNKGGRNEKKSN